MSNIKKLNIRGVPTILTRDLEAHVLYKTLKKYGLLDDFIIGLKDYINERKPYSEVEWFKKFENGNLSGYELIRFLRNIDSAFLWKYTRQGDGFWGLQRRRESELYFKVRKDLRTMGIEIS